MYGERRVDIIEAITTGNECSGNHLDGTFRLIHKATLYIEIAALDQKCAVVGIDEVKRMHAFASRRLDDDLAIVLSNQVVSVLACGLRVDQGERGAGIYDYRTATIGAADSKGKAVAVKRDVTRNFQTPRSRDIDIDIRAKLDGIAAGRIGDGSSELGSRGNGLIVRRRSELADIAWLAFGIIFELSLFRSIFIYGHQRARLSGHTVFISTISVALVSVIGDYGTGRLISRAILDSLCILRIGIDLIILARFLKRRLGEMALSKLLRICTRPH